MYLNNLIIPVNFVKNSKDSKVSIDNSELVIDDEVLDYSSEIKSIKFGLINYLVNKCKFSKNEVFIHPIVFVHNSVNLLYGNYLIYEKFDFYALLEYIKEYPSDYLCSYRKWKTDNVYDNLGVELEAIVNQASYDSLTGYITKKKIDRISKSVNSKRAIYNELNKNLIIVEGKAGTGKSSELLLLMLKCVDNGKNAFFLTYNKLLVNDIAKTVKSYLNSKSYSSSTDKVGQYSVVTLHSFFYNFSKSLGVLHILSQERISKIIGLLDTRTNVVLNKAKDLVCVRNIKYLDFKKSNLIKEIFQNDRSLDNGTKEVAIDFVNYIFKSNLLNLDNIEQSMDVFRKYKGSLLRNIEVDKVFLADYYGVLENTLLIISNTSDFYKKHNVADKFDLLGSHLELEDKHLEIDGNEIKISEKGFTEKVNRRVGSRKRRRTVFVDEAQDCHPFEKEILFRMYGVPNLVISSGGKEQLIRHTELCNWEVFNKKKNEFNKIRTSNKSYRVKKSILNFCNFIASRFQVDLNLEAIDTEDVGELIIDFRQSPSEKDVTSLFNNLLLKGEVNGCTTYESLLVLVDSDSKKDKGANITSPEVRQGKINEYGNIEDAKLTNKVEWKFKSVLNQQVDFWDGTINKGQLPVPNSSESRLIYYDSCRGLESWAVACFDIDKFFNQKIEDPDAEKFLIEDLFLNLQNEKRKSMFAATWVLMAFTRAIDTLYLKVENPNSELGKVMLEYVNSNPENTKVYGLEVNSIV